MSKRISLYIEDTEIKVLVTNGNQVEKWASLMLENGLVSEGFIQDERRVAESIKELFKLQEIKETNVVVGISGLNSVFRVISIPEVPKGLLPEAVSNEAGRVLPMSLSQVYYSYQPLPSGKEEMRLFLAAYPKNSTDALLSTVHKSGLKVQSMDLAPLALARCVNANRAILVNTWLNFVDIVVLNERIPLVIRSLPLPVEGTSTAERLEAITEELSRTITFYNSTYPEKTLDASVEVFVSGDITREKDALKLLGKIGHNVKILEPDVNHKGVFSPAQYMVNVGMALKGQLPGGAASQYSMVDFNALPQAYQPPPFSVARVLLPVGAVVAIAVLAYGSYQLVSLRSDTNLLVNQYKQLQSQADIQRASNTKMQTDIAAQKTIAAGLSTQADGIQAKIKNIAANELFFNDTLQNLKLSLDDCDLDVRELVKDIPTGLNLTDIEYQADGVTLKGTGPNQTVILAYAKALRSSGRFISVTVTSLELASDGSLNFTFQLH